MPNTTPLELPFQIGATYWAPRTHGEKVTIPCPVCKGELAVIVLCGDERHSVLCEACGKGYNGPQGTIEEYEYTPRADKFVIDGVESMHANRWYLRSTTGATEHFEVLCETEELALAVSAQRCAEQHELNMRSRQQKRKNVKEATWSVQYHRNQIKDLERQIAWHRGRITAKGKP